METHEFSIGRMIVKLVLVAVVALLAVLGVKTYRKLKERGAI